MRPHPLVFVFALSLCLWAIPFYAAGCFSPAPTPPPTLVITIKTEQIPAAVTHNPLAQSAIVDLPEGWGSCIPIHSWLDFTVFVTAKHVIEGTHGQPFWVRLDMQSPRLPVIRAEMHPTLDCGLLLVQVRTPIVQMADVPVEFGDQVFCSSWAVGRRVLSSGYVSQRDTCTASVFPGMSGGGLFKDGKLIGIVEAVAMAGAQIGPFQFALPVTFIQIFTPISNARPWIESMLPR